MSDASGIISGDRHSSAPTLRPRSLGGRSFPLLLSFPLAAMGGCFWWIGAVPPFVSWQLALLLAGLLVLNLAPFVAEKATGTFDPFDPKHIFLAYFFLLFTFNSWCRVGLDLDTNPGFAVAQGTDDLRVRALSAILVGLAAFLAGCYLPIGQRIGAILPKMPPLVYSRVAPVCWLGIGSGLLSFLVLMQSAGGIAAFLTNLSSWRTTGVLSGVGYLTFPITIILPACALLLVLKYLPLAPKKITWAALGAVMLYFCSLGPIMILGFRSSLVPAVLQFLAAWHYRRNRFRFGRIALLLAGMLGLFSLYGVVRTRIGEESVNLSSFSNAIVFRVPGFDTVERVKWRLDLGEPHRGLSRGLVEATTILVPRTVWPGKPEPATLPFADVFFYDYFLDRGDPLDGIRSGLCPTVIGELLWVGGLPLVGIGTLLLGAATAILTQWRQRAPNHPLHILISAIFTGSFALFVEAPQNTLNGFTMLTVFSLGLSIILTFRLPRTRNAA